MSSTVTINGVDVDIARPCDVVTELRKAQLILATGGAVTLSRFGQDEVQYTAANAGQLASLIRTYEAECDKAGGTRRRFAKRVTWGL